MLDVLQPIKAIYQIAEDLKATLQPSAAKITSQLKKASSRLNSRSTNLLTHADGLIYHISNYKIEGAKLKIKETTRAVAIGRRKDAMAKVLIKSGTGNFTVNGQSLDVYFIRPVLRMLIRQPLVASGAHEEYDITSTVSGGGLSGQAGAVRQALSKALVAFNPELQSILRQGGFLTRDQRVPERKKYGRAKARRSFQFSKR